MIQHHQFREGRDSSMDPSGPTILRPRVQIPSTISMLQFEFLVHYEMDDNKQKEPGIGPFSKTSLTCSITCTLIKILFLFHLFLVCSNINTSFTTNKCDKMIHPECGTGILTHYLLDMSLLK